MIKLASALNSIKFVDELLLRIEFLYLHFILRHILLIIESGSLKMQRKVEADELTIMLYL